MVALSRYRAHDFPSDERPVECRRCGFVLRPGMEKRDLCSGLNQRSELKRTPLSPVSDSNSGRSHQKDEAFRAFVRQQPCVVCGDPPPNQACHVKNWGAGWGDWLPDGTGNLYSGCADHHREEENELGTGPESFQAEHDIDLDTEAERIGREYKQFRRAKA